MPSEILVKIYIYITDCKITLASFVLYFGNFNNILGESLACVASVSVRCRSKERGTRVKDRAKNGASKRAGRGWGRKEGNQKRNPRTRISALFRKRIYKQSLVSTVVQATLGWTQEGHARRSEGERKTKTTWRTVEKEQNKAEWKNWEVAKAVDRKCWSDSVEAL